MIDTGIMARSKRERVLNEIRYRDITASEIIKNTGLSVNEVHSTLTFLKRKGFIIKLGEISSGNPGRKKVIQWRFRKDMPERMVACESVRVGTQISRDVYDEYLKIVDGNIANDIRSYIHKLVSA